MENLPKIITDFTDGRRVFKERISLTTILNILYQKVIAPNLHQQASAIAFAFTLSLFPALLFLFSLIPFIAIYVGVPNLSQQVLDILKEGIPQGIFEFIAPTIVDVLDNPRSDLVSLTFIFSLYASTGGVVDLMNTCDQILKSEKKRTFIHQRFVAFGVAGIFAVLLIFGVLVMLGGQLALHILVTNHLISDAWIVYLIIILKFFVSFLVFYVGISYVYYLAPVEKRWHFFSLGSMLASIGALLSTQGFSYYLSHFATYNKLYGSIGTIIALMVWLYILGWVLLLGFMVNAGISEAEAIEELETENKKNGNPLEID